MRVVFDTSVIVGAGYTLASPDFRALIENASRLGHELYLPQVVFDELLNKYKETIESHIKAIETALAKLGRLCIDGIGDVAKLHGESFAASYQSMLMDLIRREKFKILPYPKCSHREVVERALKRHKPFDEKGHKGYRDTIVWETVLELARSKAPSKIAFISKNTSDFCESSGSSELHPNLKADIHSGRSKRSIDVGIVFFGSLEEFVGSHIRPGLAIVEPIRQQLSEGSYHQLNLQTYAPVLLSELYHSKSFTRIKNVKPRLRLPDYIRHIELNAEKSSTDVHGISVFDVRLISKDEIDIDFSLMCKLSIDFHVTTSDFDKLPEQLMQSVNRNSLLSRVFSVFFGNINLETRLTFRLVFDMVSKQVKAWQILDIRSDTLPSLRPPELGPPTVSAEGPAGS